MANNDFGVRFGALVKKIRGQEGLSQDNLADLIWPNAAGPDGNRMKGNISKLENGHVKNPHERTVRKYCEALKIPEIEIKRLRAPFTEYGDMPTNLNDLSDAGRDVLAGMAKKFWPGISENLSSNQLRTYLNQIATDYNNLLENLPSMTAVSDLINQARQAKARFMFDEVEALLRKAQEKELECAEAIAKERSYNALLTRRFDDACNILSDFSDRFFTIDRLEPYRRRITYAEEILLENLCRYPKKSSLNSLRKMIQVSIDGIEVFSDPESWSNAHDLMGRSITVNQSLFDINEFAELSSVAEMHFRHALEIRKKDKFPLKWAATMSNLGGALVGQRESFLGDEGVRQVEKGICAYREALTILNESNSQDHWCTTQMNLALALKNKVSGIWGIGVLGIDHVKSHLNEAISCIDAAVNSRHIPDGTEGWSILMNNAATIYLSLSEVVNCPEKEFYISSAKRFVISGINNISALDHPALWGTLKLNLVQLLIDEAVKEIGDGPLGIDDFAISHLYEVVSFCGKYEMPYCERANEMLVKLTHHRTIS